MKFKDKTSQLLKNNEKLEKVSLNKKWLGLVVDTETVNNDKTIVELGLTLINNNFIKKLNYNVIIKEVWENKELLYDKKRTNYAIGKIEKWQERIDNGTLQVKSLKEITKDLNEIIRNNEVKYFIAYNVKFDKQAINNTNELYNILYSFIVKLKVIDIWYNTNVITTTREYVKWTFKHKFLTDKGHPKTSAEVVYKWLAYQLDFIEKHHAIDDIEIEIEILQALKHKTPLISGLRNHFSYYNPQQRKFYPKSQ